jgi:gliding motility-associated lipoprotein GldH
MSFKNRCGILLLILPCIISCSHKEIYFEFHSIGNTAWSRVDTAIFKINVENNAIPCDVSLEVRNNEEYAFRNIWLFVEIETPSGSVRRDTINADLADIYGRWYGKGLSLHTLSIPYETGFQFPYPGIYTYKLIQGMREDPLKGITDIGLKISKKTG